MSHKDEITESRKKDHLKPFRTGGVEARNGSNWLEYVHLIHQSLPELDSAELDLSTTFAGHRFEAPLFITGMTGGTSEAAAINRALAKTAQYFGIGFGLGSQRAMLQNPALAESYKVREAAPKAFVAGNLGGVQAAASSTTDVQKLLDAVQADALCIHLNPAQEMLQPEGDRDFRGVADAIARLVQELDVPVIVKETGAGLSRESCQRLQDSGVRYVDISGSGGTSWVGVEVQRRQGESDPNLTAFWDWGVPTAAALCDVSDSGLQFIGSGGIRTGLDVARVLALGAQMAGAASPFIQAYFQQGEEGIHKAVESILHGLRTAMLLTGSRNLDELRSAPRVLGGELLSWIQQREG